MTPLASAVQPIVGGFDPSIAPPSIAPLSPGAVRPKWSVMIPTFNCAEYLRQTLASVLAQDPGAEQMQIEVVDDCSTKDDPAAVVRELGRGRVTFYRRERNGGAIENFNTCVARSRGELVHILHGDDYLLPGYYRTIARCADLAPACALYATRCFFVDEANVIGAVTERLPALENQPGGAVNLRYGNLLQFAGVTIRRSFFEQQGGFRTDLKHCADWEMWARALHFGSGLVAPEVLACYRVFGGSDTGRLVRTAENLKDYLRCQLVLRGYIGDYDLRKALRIVTFMALEQSERLRAKGDAEGADHSLALFRQLYRLTTALPVRAGRALINRIERVLDRN